MWLPPMKCKGRTEGSGYSLCPKEGFVGYPGGEPLASLLESLLEAFYRRSAEICAKVDWADPSLSGHGPLPKRTFAQPSARFLAAARNILILPNKFLDQTSPCNKFRVCLKGRDICQNRFGLPVWQWLIDPAQSHRAPGS